MYSINLLYKNLLKDRNRNAQKARQLALAKLRRDQKRMKKEDAQDLMSLMVREKTMMVKNNEERLNKERNSNKANIAKRLEGKNTYS